MWLELLKYVGGPIALIAAFTYLSKVLIEHFFSKDLEKYKADVRLEVERNKFVFEKLHSNRAEIIASIYRQLTDAEWAIESFLSPVEYPGEPDKKTKGKEASEKFNFLSKHFHSHKIYFSETVANATEDLLREMLKLLNEYKIFTRQNLDTDYDRLHRIWEDFRKDKIPPLKSKVEKEFRSLIGIS